LSEIWYYSIDGQDKRGPISREELDLLLQRGMVGLDTLVWNPSLPQWSSLGACFHARETPLPDHEFPEEDLGEIASQISYFEIASMVLWSIFSLSMIFLTPGVGATVVGCYNIVMVVLQIPLISKIQSRRSGVIGVYESLTRLIIAGVVNIALGWYLGVLIIGFDFFIRHLVLKNRRIFSRA